MRCESGILRLCGGPDVLVASSHQALDDIMDGPLLYPQMHPCMCTLGRAPGRVPGPTPSPSPGPTPGRTPEPTPGSTLVPPLTTRTTGEKISPSNRQWMCSHVNGLHGCFTLGASRNVSRSITTESLSVLPCVAYFNWSMGVIRVRSSCHALRSTHSAPTRCAH